MDAAAELGRNPRSKHQIQPEYGDEQADSRAGTAEPVSRDQILRRERGQGNIHFPCSADHVQDWQPYSRYMRDNTYIHTEWNVVLDLWVALQSLKDTRLLAYCTVCFVFLVRIPCARLLLYCKVDNPQAYQAIL